MIKYLFIILFLVNIGYSQTIQYGWENNQVIPNNWNISTIQRDSINGAKGTYYFGKFGDSIIIQTSDITNYIQNITFYGRNYSSITLYEWKQDKGYQIKLTVYPNFNWSNYTYQSGDSVFKIKLVGESYIDEILINESPTPVKLLWFNPTVFDNHVILRWRTDNEINNKGFEVYRNNQYIGFVKANNEYKYMFYDNDYLNIGNYFYKLKQIDYNGNYEWFYLKTPITVFSAEKDDIKIFPNPYNDNINIQYMLTEREYVCLSIYNIEGRLIKTLVNETKDAGYYYMKYENEVSGIYFLIFETENYRKVNKLINMK